MGEKAGYTISNLYQGGYSSFKPSYASSSYDPKISAGSIGLTTDPRTMNLLADVSQKLSSGVKYVDVTAVSPDYFDNISKQQTKEVRRLAKLTGVDVDVHGPVINPAGFTQNGWSESERELTEKKIVNTLMRSHELNPDGNIHVNFHSSEGLPGSQPFAPSKRKEGEEYKTIIAVNRETGRLIPLESDVQYTPGGEKVEARTLTPEKRMESLNHTEWENSLFQVEVSRENAERIMQDVHPLIVARNIALKTGQLNPEEISRDEAAQIKKVDSAMEFIKQARLSADSLFSKAYKVAEADKDNEKIELLRKISKRYGEVTGLDKIEDKKNVEKYLNPKVHADALFELMQNLERIPPKTYVPVEEFAIEKGAKTYGNAAFTAYKKFKDTAPTLVIENPPAGQALATGGEIKKIVEESRKQFVSNAVKEGMSQKQAQKEAEKLIGATWDVGHANMLRKFGYSQEETIEEAAKVKSVLKHIHLSDNFGMEHTELPMGMGNVPFKEIMAKLGEKGYEAKKLIEAGQWWAQMKSPPFQETLEGIGSPVYSMKMAPHWDQAPGLYQGYSDGLTGAWLPQINYETFGTGFSRLPSDLGGARPGAQGSRMSGRGME